VLCDQGSGSFEAQSSTGVKVSVGAQKAELLATRTCQATLSWGKQKLIIAHDISQLDLDLFGADIGAGGPVAAFGISESNAACCMTYQIYSLKEPPHLVRTISGGGFFSAADTDLDGRVEIWTEDAAAVNGFEGLVPSEVEFVPTYVLRFEQGRLLDVSSQFRAFFDDVIKKVRSEIKPEGLQSFKLTDGKLQAKVGLTPEQLGQLRQVRATKIQILEIVWAYLYSGREQEAWQSLKEMWPGEDCDRIRGEIAKAQTRGLHAQLDGVSSGEMLRRMRKAPIYAQSEVTPPKAIVMRIYPPAEARGMALGTGEVHVELLIDAAGKVRSAKPAGDTKKLEEWIRVSASQWKFIPASKLGQAVASRMMTSVWSLR